MWLVFLVCLRSGERSVCAVCPCGGFAASLVASLPLMAVALGLVSVPPDYSGRAVILSVVSWSVTVGLGESSYFGGCPVWVFRFCLWWFRRSVRVVPRSFLLPLVLVVGRCLGVGSFFGRWFCCLWSGSVVSFQDCTRCRFICRCSVWVCLFRVSGVCVWSGCVPHIFAPTFAPDIFAPVFDT